MFHCGGGRLVQCLCCGSVGVEFGTTYLVFSEQNFFTFAHWLESLTWEEAHVERGRMRIRMDGEASMMLSLAREELRAVKCLLDEGVRWVANAGLITDAVSPQPMALTETVH